MASSVATLPSHAFAWDQIRAARGEGRLPHAILLHGPEGVGKEIFGRQLAALVLCERAPAGPPACGACRNCRLAAAGTHPDLHVVEPEESKVTLSIDQIRALTQDLALQPHTAAVKVALLVPADAMTPQAANALLKTLEEPPGATLLILVAARPAVLPATIRSRCRAIRFRLPPAEEAEGWLRQQAPDVAAWAPWLELAGGAPRRALDLARGDAGDAGAKLSADLAGILEGRLDPLDVTLRWAAQPAALWLGWLEREISTLVRLSMLPQNSGPRHSAASATLRNYAGHLNVTALLRYWDTLLNARRMLQDQAREQLVLEALLIPWAHRLEWPPADEARRSQ